MYDLQKEMLDYSAAFNMPEFEAALDRIEKVLAYAQDYIPRQEEEKVYPRFTLRGGNAGILTNGHIISPSGQGCPLLAYLRSWGIQKPVDECGEYTFETGFGSERVFAKRHPGWRKAVIINQDFKGYQIRGEVDFISPEDVPYELKSIQTSDYLKPYLVTGEYKLENLVQLAFYMTLLEKLKGVLRYTSSIRHACTINKVSYRFKQGDFREYVVTVNDCGQFCVDGKPSLVTVEGIVRHMEYMTWVYDTQPRTGEILKPVDEELKDGACSYCKVKKSCELCKSQNASLETFKEAAKCELGG